MTNGEKLKEIFPNIKVVAIVPNEVVIIKKLDDMATYSNNSFSYKWWNAEYKEPTTKNDLGVEKIIDEIEKEFEKVDIPIMDKLTLFAKVQNSLYKCAELRNSEIPTDSITKNCIACKYDEIEESDGEHCKKCLSGDSQFELDKEFIELTAKNDLGVECIDKSTECKHKCIDNGLRVDCNNCKNNFHRGDGISYCTTGDGMCHYECEEDCISRADAIKAMQDKAKKLTNEDTINGLCGAVAILFDLPSVTPQEPKTGHWNEIPKYKDIAWQCSECEHFTTMKHNFCPNCGAKMESEK